MNNKIPKIYVNKSKKPNNNKIVFYSYKEPCIIEEENDNMSKEEIWNILNNIFKSNDFVYKKKIFIKTKYDSGYYNIISKNIDYVLTLDNKRIYINDIVKIEL